MNPVDSHVSAPTNLLPKGQLGYILPTRVGDSIHYQFYRSCPPDMFLIAYPINLGAFSPEGVEAAQRASFAKEKLPDVEGVRSLTVYRIDNDVKSSEFNL